VAEQREPVRLVFDDSLTGGIRRMHNAAAANPIGDGEDVIDWMRRVLDAAYWQPDGWEV
jgi:hypothetical protein